MSFDITVSNKIISCYWFDNRVLKCTLEGIHEILFTVNKIYCNVFRRKWKLGIGLGFEGQRHLSRLCSKVEYLKQDKEFLYAIDELDIQNYVSILNTPKKFNLS